MSRLFKFTLLTLIFLTTLNAASSEYLVISSPDHNSLKFQKIDNATVSGNLLIISSDGQNKYYSLNLFQENLYFNKDTNIFNNVYKDLNGLYYFVGSTIQLSSACLPGSIGSHFKLRRCDTNVTPSENWPLVEAYKGSQFEAIFLKTCQADENFNTQTKQCQKCNKGQSWDSENNRCYDDCTDVNKNIFGFKNGKCLDCSGEKRDVDVAQCICKYHGSEYDNNGFTGTPAPNGGNVSYTWWSGKCKSGMGYEFKSPEAPNTPKPDNNDTNPKDPKDPKNPNGPGGGNNGGNNGPGGGNGNGKDNDNPNNPGPGGPNPDGPGDKDNEFCKKNPKDPKCKNKDNNNTKPKGPGGPGGGGPSGDDGKKDGDAKFNPGDFDDGGADKERDGLFGDIKDHINSNLSKFDGISQGITQFIDNVKGKGFDKVQADIKRKCPIAKELPLPGGNSKPIMVDYCDIVSPVSEVTYYAFYLGFAAGCFLLFLKLLLLSF